jgi:nitrous oxidase accessory protein NosD
MKTRSCQGERGGRSIAAALRAAGPGATIRILDAAVYKESLRIDEPTRLRDLTIEANQGASLESSAAEPVITIKNTPGVVLRGLRIRTGDWGDRSPASAALLQRPAAARF